MLEVIEHDKWLSQWSRLRSLIESECLVEDLAAPGLMLDTTLIFCVNGKYQGVRLIYLKENHAQYSEYGHEAVCSGDGLGLQLPGYSTGIYCLVEQFSHFNFSQFFILGRPRCSPILKG